MWVRRSGAVGAAIAVLFLTACTGGTRSASVPAAKPDGGNHVLTARARRFAASLSAAKSVPVEVNIERAAADGARVFRIEQVAIVDPASNQEFNVPRSQMKQTPDGIVLFEGAKQIVLSHEARIVSGKHYGYLFVRGAERDPDPRLHAERIR